MKTDDRKCFVVDTSVWIHNSKVLETLGPGNDIVVPQSVTGEIDHLKLKEDSRGFSARQAVNEIEKVLARLDGTKHRLSTGVELTDGCRVFFEPSDWKTELRTGLSSADEQVIKVAMKWNEKRPGQVVVLSKDTNLRVVCRFLNISAEDYRHDQVSETSKRYTGKLPLVLPDGWAHLLTDLPRRQNLSPSELEGLPGLENLQPNQCLELSYGDSFQAAIFQNGGLVHVPKPTAVRGNGNGKDIRPINLEQSFAYLLLKLLAVKLVTICGRAGSGKTLIALLAGYQQLGQHYERIIIYRPNRELGEGMGFLPGDVNEKFAPWKQPIMDNLALILRQDPETFNRPIVTGNGSVKEGLNPIQDLINSGRLEIAPINFIQGRSLNNAFIIGDEMQNLTPMEIKALVTRTGHGSKIVLTGDPDQIVNPYVNDRSNGLSHVIERFTERASPAQQERYAHITLARCERSELANIAGEIL